MNGKSGKLVAPAVAFMLCAVALIGVGFAISLNSTSTAGGNEVNNVNGVVLNLTGPDQNQATITGSAAVYYETVQTEVNGDITYNFEQSEMTIADGKVAIMSPGTVRLTYTLTVVKVLLSDDTEATVNLVFKMGSETMVKENGAYTLSKNISVTGDGAVKTGGENFTIVLDGSSSGSIGGASTSSLPAKITYNLSVSAVYDTA